MIGRPPRSPLFPSPPLSGLVWSVLQEDSGYRDRTAILITADHGRGDTPADWRDHGSKISGAENIWMAFIGPEWARDRTSTRLNSSHSQISYAVLCLKKKSNLPLLHAHLERGARGPHRPDAYPTPRGVGPAAPLPPAPALSRPLLAAPVDALSPVTAQ